MVSPDYHHTLATLLKLLSPFAPHIASQLWEGKEEEEEVVVVVVE